MTCAIARQREQQRHIDADAGADELLNGDQPRARAGDFNEDIGPIERCPEPSRLADSAGGIVRQMRIDFQADVAVLTMRGIEDAAEFVGGLSNVLQAQLLIDRTGILAGAAQ